MNPKLTFSSDTKCCRIRDKLQLCALSYHTWHFVRGHSLDYNRTAAGIDGVWMHTVLSPECRSLFGPGRPSETRSAHLIHWLHQTNPAMRLLRRSTHPDANTQTVSCNQYLRWTGQRWGYFVECVCCSFTYDESKTGQAQKSTIVYMTKILQVIYAKSHLTFTNYYNSRFQIIKFGWCYILNTFVWVF